MKGTKPLIWIAWVSMLGIVQAQSSGGAFFCGVNTRGGCCATFFMNAFDQYASGFGCLCSFVLGWVRKDSEKKGSWYDVAISGEFATAIQLTISSVGEQEWTCVGDLQGGCCSPTGGDRPPSPWFCNPKLHAADGSVAGAGTDTILSTCSSVTTASSTEKLTVTSSTKISTKKSTSIRRY
ncbi:hypothetical protein WAI453_001726 [Rhynchosporium graminicola]